MIKKSKKYPQQIADVIRSVLGYNNENPNNRIKMSKIEITRGLYNCGSIAIMDNVCSVFGMKPWDAPFTVKVHSNDSYWWVSVTYK